MSPSSSLLLLSSLAPLTALAAQTCPGGIYAIIATPLANYPPAKSFCSSKYPLSTVTVTATAPTSTITTTPATTTLTTTTGTTSITVVAAISTYVATEIDTITLTATVTATQTVTPLAKRASISSKTTTTADPRASAFSNLLAYASAFVSPACYCIEGPPTTVTTTSTPRTTTTVTATATSDVIATSLTTFTPSTLITTTQTLTSSTTISTTSTSTALPTSPACDNPSDSPNGIINKCHNTNYFCAALVGGGGVCKTAATCNNLTPCSTGADCPSGYCQDGSKSFCGGTYCADESLIEPYSGQPGSSSKKVRRTIAAGQCNELFCSTA